MIARATRALPGMVVSILLAAPAMAATTPHASHVPVTPAGKGHAATEHRKSAAKARTNVARTSVARGAHTQSVARVRTIKFITAAPASLDAGSSLGPVWNDNSGESNWRQTGVASWYGGKPWDGRRTSSGARFDQDKLTAAHATLPIGTRVRVTLEGSDRSVVVVINDRPGTHRRIIDLSRGAARELGMLNSGVAVVTLSLL